MFLNLSYAGSLPFCKVCRSNAPTISSNEHGEGGIDALFDTFNPIMVRFKPVLWSFKFWSIVSFKNEQYNRYTKTKLSTGRVFGRKNFLTIFNYVVLVAKLVFQSYDSSVAYDDLHRLSEPYKFPSVVKLYGRTEKTVVGVIRI